MSASRPGPRGPRRWLLVVLLVVLAAGSTFALTFRPPHGFTRIVSVTPADSFHAVIFRYDTELTEGPALLSLLAQDAALGLRATAFPLAQDFQRHRNVLHRFAVDRGEVQIHARPMPRGLTDAFVRSGDITPYQYDYLDRDAMLQAFIGNLRHEVDIFRANGFDATGISLHAGSNRMPWSDDVNFKLFGAGVAALGLDWVSVTSSSFSLGSRETGFDPAKFNAYDREVTVAQRPMWVAYRKGLYETHESLVIATSWRDHYGVGAHGAETLEDAYGAMLEDIERQWAAARAIDAPLVLLIHPVKFSGREPHETLNTQLKRAIIERAGELNAPVMTFSEYHAALEARR